MKNTANKAHNQNARKVEGAFNGTNRSFGFPPSSLYRTEETFILDELNSTGKRKLAKSVVGTTQYMAPEVIQGDYYDGRCDWWSIGIILYEVWFHRFECNRDNTDIQKCLFGITPFHSKDRGDSMAKILVCHDLQ
jgi:serine/threonine protein kinase